MPLTPIITLLLLALPGIVGAADSGFVPLVGIPYVDTTQTNVSLGDYVNSLYWASISIAAVLAVLRIIWAGIKYMLSEIVTEKGQAKKDIQGALYGLILIIGAVLLLDTINPTIKNLTGLDLTPLEGVVTIHDSRTACQKNSNSAECCTERNGVYTLTLTGSSCLNEDAGIGITGDPLQDELNCENAGHIWDASANICRENEGALFDYAAVTFTGGGFTISTELHNTLQIDRLISSLEAACINIGGSNVPYGTEVGPNMVYRCE